MKRWYGTTRHFAARLTALKSSPGRRMLMRASLAANSNRVGISAERSNCVRSLFEKKRSAAASVLSRGSFVRVLALRFKMLNLGHFVNVSRCMYQCTYIYCAVGTRTVDSCPSGVGRLISIRIYDSLLLSIKGGCNQWRP
jgi:hypothetical protein